MTQSHYDPQSHLQNMPEEVPTYVAAAKDGEARRIVELGIGTGETARHVSAERSGAQLTAAGVYDVPDKIDDQVAWLRKAVFEPEVVSARHDLAVRREI